MPYLPYIGIVGQCLNVPCFSKKNILTILLHKNVYFTVIYFLWISGIQDTDSPGLLLIFHSDILRFSEKKIPKTKNHILFSILSFKAMCYT